MHHGTFHRKNVKQFQKIILRSFDALIWIAHQILSCLGPRIAQKSQFLAEL